MKRARFDVYQDQAGQYRWTLRAANGRVIADSSEGYTRKRDADRAVALVCEVVVRVNAQRLAERYGPGDRHGM